jgi:hypothetical protein
MILVVCSASIDCLLSCLVYLTYATPHLHACIASSFSGRGKYYSSGLDALVKTVRSEGLLALYKGGWTHYARLGPHIILVFVFLEQLRKWA